MPIYQGDKVTRRDDSVEGKDVSGQEEILLPIGMGRSVAQQGKTWVRTGETREGMWVYKRGDPPVETVEEPEEPQIRRDRGGGVRIINTAGGPVIDGDVIISGGGDFVGRAVIKK